jgi:hypothetical protein
MTGLQVLSAQDSDAILEWVEMRRAREIPDPFERMLQSWASRTRTEALHHYLSLGWSMVSRAESKVNGVILAQPVLFFRGMTQALWVEWLDAADSSTAAALADAIVRVAREKHLQRVHFDRLSLGVDTAFSAWSAREIDTGLLEIKTTKDQ